MTDLAHDAGHRAARDRLLDTIVTALRADDRIIAAWLGGSFGRGQHDELSDLDIWIVIEDDTLPAIVANPLAFVWNVTPTIMEIHAPLNAPPGGAYLLTWIDGTFGPQQVDWYWLPATGATRPAQSRTLFERQPIALEPARNRLLEKDLACVLEEAVRESMLMAFIAVKHARRGDPWTTARQMMHLASCLGRVEWLLDHGRSPSFDDKASVPLPPDIPTTLEAQLDWISEALHRLMAVLSDRKSPTLVELDDAIRAVERWLRP